MRYLKRNANLAILTLKIVITGSYDWTASTYEYIKKSVGVLWYSLEI